MSRNWYVLIFAHFVLQFVHAFIVSHNIIYYVMNKIHLIYDEYMTRAGVLDILNLYFN